MVQDVKRSHLLFRPKPHSAPDLPVGLSDVAVLSRGHVVIAQRRSRMAGCVRRSWVPAKLDSSLK